MSQEIVILIEMQKLDDKISELQVLIKNLPEQLSTLKNNLSSAQTTLSTIHEELENNKKDQDKRELLIRSNKDQMVKYQNQLLTIQTNKEYKALNKEVSHLEQKNHELEDEIMELMELAEELREKKKETEKSLATADQELKANEHRLENEIKIVEQNMEKYHQERKVFAKELPIPLVKKYAALIQNRNRKALVYSIENTCGGCGFMIRPQVMVELHEGDKIVYCENCSRIIVMNPKE